MFSRGTEGYIFPNHYTPLFSRKPTIWYIQKCREVSAMETNYKNQYYKQNYIIMKKIIL